MSETTTTLSKSTEIYFTARLPKKNAGQCRRKWNRQTRMDRINIHSSTHINMLVSKKGKLTKINWFSSPSWKFSFLYSFSAPNSIFMIIFLLFIEYVMNICYSVYTTVHKSFQYYELLTLSKRCLTKPSHCFVTLLYEPYFPSGTISKR